MFNVGYSTKDGEVYVYIERVPLWAGIAEGWLDKVCAVTRNRYCNVICGGFHRHILQRVTQSHYIRSTRKDIEIFNAWLGHEAPYWVHDREEDGGQYV